MLMLLLFSLLNLTTISRGRTDVPPRCADQAEDFQYSFTGDELKWLEVTFGERNQENVSSSYNMWIDTISGETHSNFRIFDNNWSQHDISFHKQNYQLNTNFSYFNWREKWDTGGVLDDFIRFNVYGDVDLLKAQFPDNNFSKTINGIGYSPQGISDFQLSEPKVITINNQTELVWSTQCKSISAICDNETGIVDWSKNCSFFCKQTYHFFINETARLKIDVEFSDFDIHVDMRGTHYENGNITAFTQVESKEDPSKPPQLMWKIDSQNVSTENTGCFFADAQVANSNATIEYDSEKITEISFGKEFQINGAKNREIINWAVIDDDPVYFEWGEVLYPNNLIFGEQFTGLNFSTLETIVMDPEISIPFPQSEQSNNQSPINILVLTIMGIAIVGITIVGIVIVKKINTHRTRCN